MDDSLSPTISTKRYYWLKLRKEYWNGEKLRYIRAMENGEKYCCFWIDILMLAMNSSEPGVLRYNENLPYTLEVLAKVTGNDIDTVRIATSLFRKAGMIEVYENGEILVPDILEMVGSESESAKRVRRYRTKQKELEHKTSETPLQCNENALQSNEELRVKESRVKENRARRELEDREVYNQKPNLSSSSTPTLTSYTLKTMQTDGDVYTFIAGYGDMEREINTLKKAGREKLSGCDWNVRDYFVAIARKKMDENVTNIREVTKAVYCAIHDDEDIQGWL
jgi:predicted phage replisome organizer